MLEGELVAVIRELAGRGVGSKRIARTVGVARNTVRRYLREAIVTGMQRRPTARRLTEDGRREARALYEGPAGGNAVVCTGCCVRRIFGLVSGRWSERSPTFGVRARRPPWRRSAWKARQASSCRSILGRSASKFAASGSAFFCWSRS